MSTDTHWLDHAVDAALHGPAHDPNPRVGCVLVAPDGTLVGQGRHCGAGSPHAEVDALADAGELARGATAYVTLEPCTHHGRTGPCTRALLEAGVTRVVYAVPDPTPRAAGGADVLRDSGIDVDQIHHSNAEALVADWAAAARLGRPVVVWKAATTLDGRVAAVDGSSRWITSAPARADAHLLRARVGAVVVGTGTALRDDPSLTARTPEGELLPDQPLRVVVGERDLPPAARLRSGPGAFLHLRTHDPREVLAALARRGVHRVLLEGGPSLAAAFWRAGCVDEVLVYLAPALLGSGPSGVGDLGIGAIEDIARLELVDVARVGPDLRLSLVPVRVGAAPLPPGSPAASTPTAPPSTPTPSATAPAPTATAPAPTTTTTAPTTTTTAPTPATTASTPSPTTTTPAPTTTTTELRTLTPSVTS